MNSVAVLFFIFAFIATSCFSQDSTASPWNGSFTDIVNGTSFGTTYICTQGNSIQGVFSNYGWFQGTIDGSGFTASGVWGVAGLNDNNYGGFNWTLALDGNSFTGIYWYLETPCITFPWASDATGASVANTKTTPDASNQQCQFISQISVSAQGSWKANDGTTIDICFNPGLSQFYASFSGAFSAYAIGQVYNNGRVLQFSYFTSSSSTSSGIGMARITGAQLVFNGFSGITTGLNIAQATYFTNLYNLTSGNVPSNTACLNNGNFYTNRWVGAWSDFNFGFGRTYVCVNGNTVNGVYSEVGYITGTINGNVLTGRFHDSGVALNGDGNFVLVMDSTGNNINGNWTFDGEAISYDWTDVRVDTSAPSTLQCLSTFSINSAITVQGQWTQQLQGDIVTLDICFLFNPNTNNYTSYQLSYDTASGSSRGYGEGRILDNGTSIRGQWFETNTTGIDLYKLSINSNNLERLIWPNTDLQTVQFYPCQNSTLQNSFFDQHSIVSYSFNSGNTTTQSRCSRNSDLVATSGIVLQPTPTPQPSPKFQGTKSNYTIYGDPASASMISFSPFLVLLLLIAILL